MFLVVIWICLNFILIYHFIKSILNFTQISRTIIYFIFCNFTFFIIIIIFWRFLTFLFWNRLKLHPLMIYLKFTFSDYIYFLKWICWSWLVLVQRINTHILIYLWYWSVSFHCIIIVNLIDLLILNLLIFFIYFHLNILFIWLYWIILLHFIWLF